MKKLEDIFKVTLQGLTVISIVLIVSIVSGTYIFAENQAVAEIHQLNDLANITVKSSINVQEYQIVIHKQGNISDTAVNGTLWDNVILEGFMRDSVKLNLDNQYRWFNLVTGGHGGSITLVFDGCITVDRVNILDSDGNRVFVTGLPKTLCV